MSPIWTGGLTLFLLIYSVPLLISRTRRRHFGTPLLMLSQQKYAAGDTVEVEFVRELQGGKTLSGGELQFKVECLEIAEVKQGTDITYQTNARWETARKVPQMPGNNRLNGHFAFTIPPGQPVNQSQPKHWIVWKLTVQQNVPGQFNEASGYWLDVGQQVTARTPTLPAVPLAGRHG